jgi:hypothetical protein
MENLMTENEAKVIQYAATGAHDLRDTDKLWELTRKLYDDRYMVYINNGTSSRYVPTPEALAEAWDVLNKVTTNAV